jgi:hypothetical protein
MTSVMKRIIGVRHFFISLFSLIDIARLPRFYTGLSQSGERGMIIATCLA